MIPNDKLGGNTVMPSRKRLDHRGPLSIDVASSWYFITICAEGHRPWACGVTPTVGGDHRAPRSFEDFASLLLDEARFMHNAGKWFLSLMLVMPDHLHLIVHGPPGGRPLPLVIGDFKRYLTLHHGIRFQRDFWDTRLRDDAHYGEKFRNPVRKGLCAAARSLRSTEKQVPSWNISRSYTVGRARRARRKEKKRQCTTNH